MRRLLDAGQTEISKRGLFQLVNGRMGNMERMQPRLNVLLRRGYLCLKKHGTGGRPTGKSF
ncbi:MAG: hypothetical protein MR935_09915 [Agathobaculum sp.]|uniref:hypothetical protein n=1 Tax=Agathobaculum sp. TaxID=2048138 RepID=UPI0025B8CD8B|nr:hypothetical protein [Agathobaculum sp.]MCI7126486.1 hypothetical protein [Agathobaculum sp.]MDY3618356.1 hypothetical protein [Agathobaculum sp.]